MNIVDLIRRCIRILYIARKPTNDEFQEVAKVTAIGMLVIGFAGLIIWLLFTSF